MIVMNSVFAAFEIALAAVSVARLRILSQEKRAGAAAAVYMKENVEGSLAAIQIGITLFGAVAAATGGAGAEEQVAPWLVNTLGVSAGFAEFLAIAAVVLPLTVVTILLGELVPKVFALRNKEWVCLKLSPPMLWFTRSVFPAVWLFEWIVMVITGWGQSNMTSQENQDESNELQDLRSVASLARMSRLIGAGEERIIHGAARISSQRISEIMLPAAAISMLKVDGSIAEGLVAAHLDMHTRFPVTEREGDPQAIVGYVNLKDIVAVMRLSPKDPTLRSVVRPLLSFRDNSTIAKCLEELLRRSSHISLIRDAAGVIVGMVTLEDILEELLGDIRDEFDQLPTQITPAGGAWVVGGGVSLTRLREITGIDLSADSPSGTIESLNDWFAGHMGGNVPVGGTITRAGARILVRKVRRNKLLEAQVGRA